MNQPVHIFKKDARHLWPEVLVSLALLLALAWVTPHNHGTPNADLPWLYPLLGGFIKFLIPITWLVLISRLVHDETLVGDRQFWITRPYTWYGLLAAKLLFLLAFIYLPLLLVQSFLLHHAGLHPVLAAVPFLKNFGSITALIVLPLLALAAVTSTFIRFALSVLAAVIYVIVIVVVAALTVPNKIDVPGMGYVYGTLLVAIPLAALLLQYRYRKTAVARTLLIALPTLLYLVAVITPASALIGHSYAAALPFKTTFDGNADFQQHDAGEAFQFKKKVMLRLPVRIEGLADRASLSSQHASFTLDGPNGFHYASGWVEAFNSLAARGGGPSAVTLQLPVDVYNRLKDTPVTLALTLGVERMEPAPDYSVPGTVAPFPIPGGGACNFKSKDPDSLSSQQAAAQQSASTPGTLPTDMNCNFAFSNPAIAVEADASAGACPAAGPTGNAPQLASFITPSPNIPTLDPVASDDVDLHPGPQNPMALRGPANLCPGAKIHFSELKSTAKGSVLVTAPSVTLNNYAVRMIAPNQTPK